MPSYSDVGQIRSLNYPHHHHHHRSAHTSRTTSPTIQRQDFTDSKGRMRWILSLGLLLPALAAIIGVVAWAVSAEVMMGARRDAARKNNDATQRFHQILQQNSETLPSERIEQRVPGQSKSLITADEPISIQDTRNEEALKLAHNTNNMVPQSRTSVDADPAKDIAYLFSDDDTQTKGEDTNTNTDAIKNTLTGTKVAEVIDKLVAQRKALNPNAAQKTPQIVVVAPFADPSSYGIYNETEESSSTEKPISTTVKTIRTTSKSTYRPSNKISNRKRTSNRNKHGSSSKASDLIISAIKSKARRTTTTTERSIIKDFEDYENDNFDKQQHRSNSNQHELMIESAVRETFSKPELIVHSPSSMGSFDTVYGTNSANRMNNPSLQKIVTSGYSHYHHPVRIQQQQPPPPPHIMSMTQPSQAPQPMIMQSANHHQLPHHMHNHNRVPPPPLPFLQPQGSMPQPMFHLPPQQFSSQGNIPPHMLNKDLNFGANIMRNKESSRAILVNPGSVEPQESSNYGNSVPVPDKGVTFHMGGGPMGGGGQLVTSPLGIMKTLLLPLMPKPRMNLNGKVVFGVVLENGVGFGKNKKPKMVAQHYSEGRY